jgi:3-dehydroquinate synthase
MAASRQPQQRVAGIEVGAECAKVYNPFRKTSEKMSTAPAPPHRNEVIRQRITVPFEYPVVFTRGLFAPSNLALRNALSEREPTRHHRAFVVLDAGFAAAWPEVSAQIEAYFKAHADRLELVAAPATIPGGEAAKNDPQIIEGLQRLFHRHRIDRHSFVITVGGGAAIDAAGYAAATTHRGLRTVRVPTTVLAQNDAGVGVKNGVNAFGAKNFLGTFVPPFAVLCDTDLLARLPRREAIAGLAEAVKVALIRDAAFFAWIEDNASKLAACELPALAELVHRCAELHLKHIATSGDPFEYGSARPLDFGHWSAHKLEGLTHHEVRHGEAVALGMLLDSRYALKKGLLAAADFERIAHVLRSLGLPQWHDQLVAPAEGGRGNRPALLGGLEDFREHLGGELTITLVSGVGKAVEVHEMDEALILEALDWMRAEWSKSRRP